MSGPVIALFCGSRNWPDHEAIWRDVDALPEGSVVIHGNASGADKIAGHRAMSRGLHTALVDALWGSYGRAAGPKRNAAMLMLRPDVVYAYPLGGPGTRGMIALAREAGVEVIVRARG